MEISLPPPPLCSQRKNIKKEGKAVTTQVTSHYLNVDADLVGMEALKVFIACPLVGTGAKSRTRWDYNKHEILTFSS